MTLAVSKEFTKKYGDVLKPADKVLEEFSDYNILPTIPSLDEALGGGVQEGGLTLISGDPKSGKSSLALHMCINAVKEGRPVVYVDAEGRLKNKQLTGIDGLDECLPNITKICPPDDEEWAAEEYLNAVDMLIRDPDNAGILIIIDSVSSLIPRCELDAELSSQIRDTRGKLLGHWTKKMAGLLLKQRAMVVMVRHFIADTGPSRKTKIADGGRKITYQADTIIDVGYTSPWTEGDEQVGHVVHWNVVCSSLGASGRKAESYLRYGNGFDVIKDYIDSGVDLGLIKKGGSWYTLLYTEEEVKKQGSGRLRDHFLDTPADLELLKEKIHSFYV
jgi:recombination protein RecA